jgi:HK97 gp10 family phage protein
VTTVVHGVPQAVLSLEARKIAAKIATPIAARAGGEIVQNVMQALAPKQTGTLAASIQIDLDGDECHVGSTVDYDRFVQFGTTYMGAQPYGERAGQVAAPGVAATMAAIYKTAIG